MTRLEAFDEISELVRKYIKLEHPEHTTVERMQVLELLDDVERLLKG